MVGGIKMALPKWEDLSPEEKKVYDDKVSNIVNIIEEIDPDGFMILTGANGGGKSLIR
jgi:ABC-type Mn2+/Zn2+ transport system ATPase subunit